MANVVWVFFVDARKGEVCESLCGLGIKLAGALSRSGARREEKKYCARNAFHRLITP
jgi:hypothetical protein